MKHETRNTVSVSKWCNKCRRMTQHKVSDRRVQHCLECGQEPPTYKPSGHKILVQLPCECGKYPFAHFHSKERA